MSKSYRDIDLQHFKDQKLLSLFSKLDEFVNDLVEDSMKLSDCLLWNFWSCSFNFIPINISENLRIYLSNFRIMATYKIHV